MNIHSASTHLLVLCLACFFVPVSKAAEPIKAIAKPLLARGTVEVSNVRGTIHVTGWERNAVAVTGSLGADTRLVFEGSDNRLLIRAEKISETKGWFKGWGESGPKEDTELQIHVPFEAALELEGISADIDVRKIKNSDSLKTETVSGDIDIKASTARLDVSSVSGDIEFIGAAERTQAGTVSGDIRLEGINGELSVDAVSGDVSVIANTLKEIDGGSVSGDLEFRTALHRNADVEIESMSGEITLVIPGNTDASVHAETFSGSLRADFSVDIIDEDGPGSEMKGKLGTGSARIKLESFSGDIRLRKQ